tara:strand:+ start:654 stop:1025 length:372 start_codon:yes stop_codon:yes gene_type:complete
MMIDDDVKITINLNKLVDARARLLTQYENYASKISTGEYLDENDVDRIASKLRDTLSWESLFQMVDESILEYLDINETHYGEIQPEPGREAYLNDIEKNRKKFKIVKLESSAWTIDVPVRVKD